jgi:beta-barrel assembly-enhancing protease
MLRNRVFLPIAMAAALFAAGCGSSRQPGQPLKPGFNLFSAEQDVELGREAAQQVRQEYDVVSDPFLQSYLDTLGKRLAATPAARESGFPFSFTLVNDPNINAFALPGGPMFIHSGLIKAAANEAQLAGVMAHEMAHVILRHGTNQVSRAYLLQLPAMLAAGAVGGPGILGQLGQLGVGLGYQSILLSYSRGAETESDALGARIMAQAGFNPIESARFFETLEAEGGPRGPQFLASHPNPGNRMRNIEAEIRTMPQMQYDFRTGQFARAQQTVAALPPPSKTRSARLQAPAEAAPAGEWQELRARTFRVAYPGNWEAFGGADSASVTVAPRQGIVAVSGGGGHAVGYGAVLSYYAPEARKGGDLRSHTEELIGQLRAQNPGLRVLSPEPRRVNAGGARGLVTMLEGRSPYGGLETNALLTVARPEGLFYMVFVAPQRDFAQLESTFSRMMDSLRFGG